jgi:hypothetical protein
MSEAEVSVRIERDIYEYLKGRSTFEDTVSTVLRRELDLPTPPKHVQPLEDGGAHQEVPIDADRTPLPQQRDEMTQAGGTTSQWGRKPVKRKRTRVAAGVLLPEVAYHRPILEILAEKGKSAPKQVVIDELGRRLNGRLTEADRDTLSNGSVRWQSRAQFARLRLVDRGYLNKNSPRGTWAITAEGIKALEEGKI